MNDRLAEMEAMAAKPGCAQLKLGEAAEWVRQRYPEAPAGLTLAEAAAWYRAADGEE